MRVRAASVKENALRSPFLTVRAMSEALIHSIVAASGFEDRRGFGVVRQGKGCDQGAVAQRHFEMAAHRRHPRLVDGEIERAGARDDEIVEWLRFALRGFFWLRRL